MSQFRTKGQDNWQPRTRTAGQRQNEGRIHPDLIAGVVCVAIAVFTFWKIGQLP